MKSIIIEVRRYGEVYLSICANLVLMSLVSLMLLHNQNCLKDFLD